MRKRKKTPEEKATVLKMKRKQRRAKRKAMKNQAVDNNTSQGAVAGGKFRLTYPEKYL